MLAYFLIFVGLGFVVNMLAWLLMGKGNAGDNKGVLLIGVIMIVSGIYLWEPLGERNTAADSRSSIENFQT